MKEEINLMVKTIKPITEKVICDVCGKTIADKNNRDAKYWTLLTHHDDWGNDSCDSYEHFDLCSKDCVKEKLNKYFDDCERSHTQEFELRQETISIDISELNDINVIKNDVLDENTITKKEAIQWIPTSERLPKHSGDYLVTMGINYDGAGMFDCIRVAPYNICFGWGLYERNDTHTLFGEITAWAKLPKKYS